MLNQLVPNKLDTLAGIINTAQKNIEYHAKSMLFEAKEAGEALLEAKAQLKHGEFKPWVEANCSVKWSMAKRYMQVARQWEQRATTVAFSDLSEMSIRQFLDIKDKPKAQTKRGAASAPVGDTKKIDDHRVMKVATMAMRGTEGEKQAANSILAKYTDDQLREVILKSFTEGIKKQPREELLDILSGIAEEVL